MVKMLVLVHVTSIQNLVANDRTARNLLDNCIVASIWSALVQRHRVGVNVTGSVASTYEMQRMKDEIKPGQNPRTDGNRYGRIADRLTDAPDRSTCRRG